MSDIAQLGLSIDSTQVTQASAALDSLTDSATAASAASGSFQAAGDQVAATFAGVSAAASGASDTLGTVADGIDMLAASSASAKSLMTQFSAALDAAVGDLNVLAVAQKNGTTLANEGSESFRSQREVIRGIAADFALFGGSLGQTIGLAGTLYLGNEHLFTSFDTLKAGIASLLTPQNLLIGGFGALAVASYTAITSIIAQEKEFDNLASKSDETLQSVHALADAASFKGIDSADFLKNMTQFSTLSADAKDNIGSLAELFRANGVAAGTMNNNLLNVGNLVQNAASNADKYRIIQEAGLPATRQWVDFLSQGTAGIKDATLETVPFGNAADQNLIEKAREFDETWNKSWANFKTGAQDAVVTAASWLSQLGSKVSSAAVGAVNFAIGPNAAAQYQHNIGLGKLQSGMGTAMTANSSVNQFYSGSLSAAAPNGNPSGSKGTTVDPNVAKNNIQLTQQQISLLGPLASVEQTVQEKENQINLARLNGVPVTKAQEQAILDYTRAQALGITQINSQTDALNVQIESFGMASGAAAAYTALQTKMNVAYRTGNPLTQQQIALIRQNADALGDATERLEEMQVASDSLSSGMKTFRQDLEDNKSAWTALKDAAATALNSISDKLIDMAAKNLVGAALGGSGASGGGLLGGLFGGLFGGNTASPTISQLNQASVVGGGLHSGGITGQGATFFRTVPLSVFDGAPRFHTGGIIGSDEVPTITKVGEGVFTPQQMKNLAPVGSQRQAPPNITITQHNDFTNADPGSEARIRSALQQTKDQAVTESLQAVLKLQRNAPGQMRPG